MAMKKYIYIALLAVVSASCSLEETRDGFVDRAAAYDTKDQAQAVVNKCYTYLNNFITTNFGLMVEACTDLWYCSTSTVDASLNINPNNPGVGSSIWNNCYAAVMCCNEAIECINVSENISDEDKGPLQAEARVLRALYYYYLTNTFNGVPFYTHMVADRETQDAIQLLPRTDANVIRQALYEDLRDNALPYFTEKNGLKKRPSEIAGNRAGYALSLMLMAKFCMWTGEWKDAISALTELEDLYLEFSEERYPLEETLWNTKNTAESIFELQHSWSVSGVQYSSSYGRATLPAYSGESIFDGIYMPELGENLASWATFRTNHRFLNPSAELDQSAIFNNPPLVVSPVDGKIYLDRYAIETGEVRGEKLDRRAALAVGLGKIETGETFNKVKEGSYCHAGPKLWCVGMVSSYDSNNYKLFRYADALLMMAECYIEYNGDLARANYYLNKTRTRAGLDAVDFADRLDLERELRAERARELGGELHRKYDLVRWGIWYTETSTHNKYNVLKSNIRPWHEYYPIPDTECALSNYILTNDAYDKGMSNVE